MAWIKRNLYFLISSLVAVALLGLAGFYFYSNWKLNNDNLEKLNSAYNELKDLASARPNPGNDKVNNIDIANQQRSQLQAVIEKERTYFKPVLPIPNTTNGVATKEEFASALRRTLDELAHAADAASVQLPPKYNFSFEAERSLTIFAEGTLEMIPRQLGEVKALCNILFQAKVNSLDNLRRERVSSDDANGPASDYLETASRTNQYAVIAPYEVAFHCFSGELATVLAGFASDNHGFVVRGINVESGVATESTMDMGGNMGMGMGMPMGAPMTQPVPAPASMGMAPAAGGRGSLPIMIDEKQLKVTMAVDVIKPLPTK